MTSCTPELHHHFVCLQLQPLFLLSLSDLMLAVCWLIGATLFSKHCNSLYAYCYHLHTLEQVTQQTAALHTHNLTDVIAPQILRQIPQ